MRLENRDETSLFQVVQHGDLIRRRSGCHQVFGHFKQIRLAPVVFQTYTIDVHSVEAKRPSILNYLSKCVAGAKEKGYPISDFEPCGSSLRSLHRISSSPGEYTCNGSQM